MGVACTGLYIVSCSFKRNSSIISTLATDHLNDVFSNSVAMIGGGLSLYWKNADPVGATMIGICIDMC